MYHSKSGNLRFLGVLNLMTFWRFSTHVWFIYKGMLGSSLAKQESYPKFIFSHQRGGASIFDQHHVLHTYIYHLIDVDTRWWLVKQAGNTILYYPFVRSYCAWPWYFSVSPAQQLCIPCEPRFRFMILPFGWFSTIHCFHVRLALLSFYDLLWQKIFPCLTVDKARFKIIIMFILINSMCVSIHFVKFVFMIKW